ADRARVPLKVYAYLELGVGLYAVLYQPLAGLGERAYGAWAMRLGPAAGPRTLLAALLLIPPTVLMGGAFAAAARHAARPARSVAAPSDPGAGPDRGLPRLRLRGCLDALLRRGARLQHVLVRGHARGLYRGHRARQRLAGAPGAAHRRAGGGVRARPARGVG